MGVALLPLAVQADARELAPEQRRSRNLPERLLEPLERARRRQPSPGRES